MKIHTLITLIFLFISSFTSATNYSWIGTTSTAWNTSTNWSPSGVPDSVDNVTITNQTNSPVLSQNRKVSSFTMTSGVLDLNNFTLTITGLDCYFNSGSIEDGTIKVLNRRVFFNGTYFNCQVNVNTGLFELNGGQFDYPVSLQDTGYYNSIGNGGCIFNDSLTIIHDGDNLLQMSKVNGDIYNGPVTITNHTVNAIYLAYLDTSFFNSDLKISNTSTGGFILGHAGGYSFLASGKNISIGSEGFDEDFFTIQNFTQLGSTSQTLTLTDTAIVNLINCVFHGNVTITAPSILLKNNVFHGTTSFTRVGTRVADSYGGNTFNGSATFSNSGAAGRYRLATTSGDTFNSDVTFNSSGQDFQVAYKGNNYFSGNITTNSDKVVFNVSTGKVICSGNLTQTFTSSHPLLFENFTLNKTTNNIVISTDISIDDSLIFINGKIISSSTNILTMKAGSDAVGANNNSFISGPCTKLGSTAFIFPVGKNNTYAPIEITAPVNSTFIAEYIDTIQTYGIAVDTSLNGISNCEYWTLARTTGSSNVKVKLFWTNSSCNVSYPSSMRVANWNGTKWVNLGQDSYGGTLLNGYVKGLNNPSLYSAFCFANTTVTYTGPPDLEELSNYALFAGKSILSDTSSFANGKAGSVNDVINVLSNDSVLTNNSGSVPAAFVSLEQAIMYANGLSGTLINDSLDGSTYSSGIFKIPYNEVINDSIILLGDTTSYFIFVFNGDLQIDSGAVLICSGVPSNNIFWIVNGHVISGEYNDILGIILSKDSINFEKNHNPLVALMSLDFVNLSANDDGTGPSYFTSPFIQSEEYNLNLGGGGGCSFVYSCNEVQNSDFSANSTPPSAIGQITRACPWYNPGPSNLVSPDYFSSIATNLICSIPNNFQGCENDHTTGTTIDGYAGIWCYNTTPALPNSNYREYIQQQLFNTLNVGTQYYGEMYISLSDKSNSSINSLGMLFSPNPVPQANNNTAITALPQITSVLTQQQNNTTGWTRVFGCFTATNNENFITIGNFNNNTNTTVGTNTNPVNCPNTSTQWPSILKAYYYIDDVTVLPILVDAGPDQTVPCDETVQLGLATCINPLNTGQFTYLWTELTNPLGATLSDYTIYNPTVTFLNNTGSTVIQTYSVTITSPGGCSFSDEVVIAVESCETEACDHGLTYCLNNWVVTGNEVWDINTNPGIGCSGNNITIQNQLIIPANTSLTISGLTVRFGPLGKIIVQRGTIGSVPGGRLHIEANNGTPTRLLPNSDECMWEGIEVWGYRNFNPGEIAQGYIDFSNSELSYAHCGILFGRRNNPMSLPIAAFTGGTTEFIQNSLFKDNYVGIRFPNGYSPNFLTLIPIFNNEFLCEASMRDPIYGTSRTLSFIDIINRNNNFNDVNANIMNNTFMNTPSLTSNATIGINCNSCRGLSIVQNDFQDVDRGIFFLGGGQGNVSVANDFRNVNIGIYNLQNRDNILYDCTFNGGIPGNFGVSQGILNERSVGTLIQENIIENFWLGLNVARSGTSFVWPVRILGNFVDNCLLSLGSGGNNFYSVWWCNNLWNYNTGKAWTLGDLSPVVGANIASIQPQGICGISPAANTFNITSGLEFDIDNISASTNFTYNYNNTSAPNYIPDQVNGNVNANPCIISQSPTTFCSQIQSPFRLIDDIISQRDTTSNNIIIENLNTEIYSYYIRVNEIDSAISFIDTMQVDDLDNILLDLYFMKNNVDSTNAILDRFPTTTQEEINYVKIMTIMIDLMTDSLSLYEMDSLQLSTVISISLGTDDAAHYAKAIINTLYAKPIDYTCDVVFACGGARISQPFIKGKKLDILINKPNPCTKSSIIVLPVEAKNKSGLKLKMYNQMGILIAEIPVQNTNEYEFSCNEIANGLYLYYFESHDYRSIVGKMMVIK